MTVQEQYTNSTPAVHAQYMHSTPTVYSEIVTVLLLLLLKLKEEKTPRAMRGYSNMAARQLIPDPTGADTELDPGFERAHPNSAVKGSTQVRLRARARAWGTSWPGPAHNLALLALAWATGQSCPLLAREVSAAKTPSGVAAQIHNPTLQKK
eukprot:scaffold3329_cov120-Isochrysis_galbana.AAC.3